MKAYPIELRQRVLHSVDNNVGTRDEIARMFNVSTFWIRKLLRQRHQTGDIAPYPRNQLILAMVLIPLVPSVVLGWVFVLMSSLTVSIDQDFVRARFGGGMWRKKISLEKITACCSVKNNWCRDSLCW